MPAAFERCVKRGGKVRTIDLPDGKYMRVCWLDGKAYSGHVKKRRKRAK